MRGARSPIIIPVRAGRHREAPKDNLDGAVILKFSIGR